MVKKRKDFAAETFKMKSRRFEITKNEIATISKDAILLSNIDGLYSLAWDAIHRFVPMRNPIVSITKRSLWVLEMDTIGAPEFRGQIDSFVNEGWPGREWG